MTKGGRYRNNYPRDPTLLKLAAAVEMSPAVIYTHARSMLALLGQRMVD